MALIWLAEIHARLEGSPSSAVLRVATYPGYNHPSAPGYYPARLVQAALLKRHITADGSILGQSELTEGELVVDNIDGEYDDFLTYGYGDPAVLLLGDSDGDYADFTTVLTNNVDQPSGDSKQLTFRFQDRQSALDLLVSPVTYLGDNFESPSTGLEGTANTLKGKNKIRIFGAVNNVDPDPIDSGNNLFSANHDKAGNLAPVAQVAAQRVNGAPWTFDANYADLPTLYASPNPGQGFYDTVLAQGLIQPRGTLGTVGQGTVTADIVQTGGSPNGNHISGVLESMLLDAGVASANISAVDLAQLEVDAPYECGVVVRGETYRQATDLIRVGACAWLARNRLGVYNVRKIKPPSGTPVATFRRFDYPNVAEENDFAIKTLERATPNDTLNGAPAWQVIVNYLRMWTVQSADALAASLNIANRALYSSQSRSVTAENAAIKDQFPLAGTITVDTVLTRESDAQALAQHVLSLLGVRRDLFALTAQYHVPLASAIDLGDVVKVYHPRFGLSGGKLVNVHGFQYDARKFEVELELWG